MKKVTLLIPVYNEEAMLPALYQRLIELINRNDTYEWEILFINDGSSDQTLDVIPPTQTNGQQGELRKSFTQLRQRNRHAGRIRLHDRRLLRNNGCRPARPARARRPDAAILGRRL